MRVRNSILLLAGVASTTVSASQEANRERSTLRSRSRVLMADPASTNCVKKGGSQQSRYDVDGGQWAVCTFADGSACEEWSLFRGECSEKQYCGLYYRLQEE